MVLSFLHFFGLCQEFHLFFNVVLWIEVVILLSKPFSLTSYKTKSYGMCILHCWCFGDFIYLRPQTANSNLLIWNYPTSFIKWLDDIKNWYKNKTKLTSFILFWVVRDHSEFYQSEGFGVQSQLGKDFNRLERLWEKLDIIISKIVITSLCNLTFCIPWNGCSLFYTNRKASSSLLALYDSSRAQHETQNDHAK